MKQTSSVQLSVVLPAYDEGENIDRMLRDACVFLPQCAESFEVIVVNDGSRDNTLNRLLAHRDRCSRLKIIDHGRNRGYGTALRNGFAASRGRWLFFTDCDCQFRFSDLQPMVALLQQEALDAVIGYRRTRNDPPLRKLYSTIYNLLVKRICAIDVRDANCAFKLFTRQALTAMVLRQQDYLINVEILAWMRLLNLRWREMGVRHYPRAGGRSKVGLADSARTLKGMLHLRRSLPETALVSRVP
jgi:dolichol-phosphate mannosyltransferase